MERNTGTQWNNLSRRIFFGSLKTHMKSLMVDHLYTNVKHGTQEWCCWKWVFCSEGWFSDSMLNFGRVSSRRCWKSRGWHFHPNWTHVLVDHMFFLSLSSCSIWPLLNYIAKLLAEFSRFATISWNNFQVTAIMSTSKCSRGLLRMMTSALTYPNTGRPWITDNWMRASMNKLQGHIPI